MPPAKRSRTKEQQKKKDHARRRERELRKCKRSRSLAGCRRAVFESKDKAARAGKLSKKDLIKNSTGKVVSKRKSEISSKNYNKPSSGLRAWNEAAKRALEGGVGSSLDVSSNTVKKTVKNPLQPNDQMRRSARGRIPNPKYSK